jgi:regulator of CtrA degradation
MLTNLNILQIRIKNANELLKETHEYIKWQAPLDIQHMSREEVYKVSCEAMRVTVRITRIIGWLMLQKAISEDEALREEILADQLRILEGESCLDETSESDVELPYRLRELLKKSRSLYTQTMRLEENSFKRFPSAKEIKKKAFKGNFVRPLVCLKRRQSSSDKH